jgi:glycosyltransferase involved in cell wall biosynthesis
MYQLAIIIPIYKVSKSINECVEAFARQYRKDFQYIFVNDGCPEQSLELALRTFPLFFREKNIVVINQENMGVSDARNNGFKKSNARYISFFDSDDVISSNYCAVISSVLKNYDADIIEFNFQSLDSTFTEQAPQTIDIQYQGLMSGIRDNLIGKFSWYCGRRIFKQDLVRHQLFTVGIWLEDFLYTGNAYEQAKTVLVINNCLYYYRRHEESATKVNWSDNSAREIWYNSIKEIYRQANQSKFFNYKFMDGIDVLAAQLAPDIYQRLTFPRILSKDYFRRCWYSARHVSGGNCYRRLFMLTMPKGYLMLMRLIRRSFYDISKNELN